MCSRAIPKSRMFLTSVYITCIYYAWINKTYLFLPVKNIHGFIYSRVKIHYLQIVLPTLVSRSEASVMGLHPHHRHVSQSHHEFFTSSTLFRQARDVAGNSDKVRPIFFNPRSCIYTHINIQRERTASKALRELRIVSDVPGAL